jgi:hypothetical protein
VISIFCQGLLSWGYLPNWVSDAPDATCPLQEGFFKYHWRCIRHNSNRVAIEEKLVASDNPWGFGSAVAVSGRYAIVGAKGDINSAGSAYTYEIAAQLSPPPPRPSTGSIPAIPLLLMDD